MKTPQRYVSNSNGCVEKREKQLLHGSPARLEPDGPLWPRILQAARFVAMKIAADVE